MNRAIAVAELEGPEAGLAYSTASSSTTTATTTRRAPTSCDVSAGTTKRALHTRALLELTQPGPEQRFLERRLARLSEGSGQRLVP